MNNVHDFVSMVEVVLKLMVTVIDKTDDNNLQDGALVEFVLLGCARLFLA